jgi:AcrR family transcriptional regulator
MKSKQPSSDCVTRARLLETAGRVFAEKGFRGATVRDICNAAGANVAAINYHFGDKSGLYSQAIRYWAEIAEQRHPLDEGLGPKASAADRLRAFISAFLRRLLDDDRPSWHAKLVSREMAEPTPALDAMVRDFYGPFFRRLCKIVREIVGTGPDERAVSRCAFSILGQCLYHHHARQVIARLLPRDGDARNVGQVAAHISEFSLLALRQLARKKRISRK